VEGNPGRRPTMPYRATPGSPSTAARRASGEQEVDAAGAAPGDRDRRLGSGGALGHPRGVLRGDQLAERLADAQEVGLQAIAPWGDASRQRAGPGIRDGCRLAPPAVAGGRARRRPGRWHRRHPAHWRPRRSVSRDAHRPPASPPPMRSVPRDLDAGLPPRACAPAVPSRAPCRAPHAPLLCPCCAPVVPYRGHTKQLTRGTHRSRYSCWRLRGSLECWRNGGCTQPARMGARRWWVWDGARPCRSAAGNSGGRGAMVRGSGRGDGGRPPGWRAGSNAAAGPVMWAWAWRRVARRSDRR
jgi:hypothetical protein